MRAPVTRLSDKRQNADFQTRFIESAGFPTVPFRPLTASAVLSVRQKSKVRCTSRLNRPCRPDDSRAATLCT